MFAQRGLITRNGHRAVREYTFYRQNDALCYLDESPSVSNPGWLNTLDDSSDWQVLLESSGFLMR